MSSKLTHVDLFSGIGGFALAARWAGFETKCFSENDTYASAVLKKHWPDVPTLGDITKADFGPYAGATLLTGGFPCQPFSVAGKQRGKADDRFLWPAMLAAIATVKPAWIVGENVAGIIRMELDRVLADLEGQGYTAFPLVIPACAVDAKHRRDRVWIVANASGGRLSGTGEGQIQLPRGAETISTGEALADGESVGRGEVRGGAQGQGGHADECGKDVANASSERCGETRQLRCDEPEEWTSGEGEAVANADGVRGAQKRGELRGEAGQAQINEGRRGRAQPGDSCWWPTEPAVGRVVNGLPRRVDRIQGLGNAIVPQVAFQILKAIADIERGG